MPTVEDHKEAAKAALRHYAQPDTEPKLDDPELNAILNRVQRASFWEPSKAFVYGAVILPVTKNGHRYRVLEGGTTGTTEPTWPKRNGAAITDGTVRWEEAGADFDNVFDVRAAAHEAWMMKAAKASVLIDRDRQMYSQITEHCRQMAERFGPVKFA
jgi:hypothetical protein